MIIGLYSIDLYKNFNFGPPLSTSFTRFSTCQVYFCKYLGDIFFASLKYVYNSLYLLPASFGCLLRAAERQPATLRLVKQSKSSKMINSKDKVDFLVQVTFFCNLEPFLFHVRGDMLSRPRYADAESANLIAISADRKQKSFEIVKKNPYAKFQPFNLSNHNFKRN